VKLSKKSEVKVCLCKMAPPPKKKFPVATGAQLDAFIYGRWEEMQHVARSWFDMTKLDDDDHKLMLDLYDAVPAIHSECDPFLKELRVKDLRAVLHRVVKSSKRILALDKELNGLIHSSVSRVRTIKSKSINPISMQHFLIYFSF